MKTEDILALCARPQGLRVADLAIPNGSTLRVRTDERLRELEKQGRVFKAKISHKLVYWFATKEAAELAQNVAAAAKARREATVKVTQRAPWPADAVAVVDENTRFTQCPSHPPRFQALGAIEFGLQRGRVTR